MNENMFYSFKHRRFHYRHSRAETTRMINHECFTFKEDKYTVDVTTREDRFLFVFSAQMLKVREHIRQWLRLLEKNTSHMF